MRNRKVIILGAVLVIVLALSLLMNGLWLFLIFRDPIDEELIEEIFGISKDSYEYEIVSAENTLEHLEYSGVYIALIDINEEKISELIMGLEADGYRPIEKQWEMYAEGDAEEYEVVKEEDAVYIEKVTGIAYDEKQKIYISFSGLQRTIKYFPAKYRNKGIPERLVVCYPAADGVCRVFLYYLE